MSAWAPFALGLALGTFAWLAVAFVMTVWRGARQRRSKLAFICSGCGKALPALGPVTVYLGAHYHSDARCLPEEARPRPHVH